MTAASWAIASVEFRRLFRDKIALFFVIVLPVAIIVVVGSESFGGEGGVPVGLYVVQDGAAVDALEAASVIDLRRIESRNDLVVDVRMNELSGGVIVDGDDVTLMVDFASSGATSTRTLVAGILAEESMILGIADAYDLPVERVRSVAESTPRSQVVRTVLGGEPDGDAESEFSYTAPAQLVLFTFLNSLAVGSGLTATKQLGIFPRWRAAPVRRREMVAGIIASRVGFAAVQGLLILGIGGWFLGVDWGDPLGALVLTSVFVLVGTAVSVLAGLLARTPQQTSAIGVPVGIGLGMLGGCMWPLDFVPEVMRTIGHVTPHAWAMDAWKVLIFDRGSVLDIGMELAVLGAFAVVLLGASVRVADNALR